MTSPVVEVLRFHHLNSDRHLDPVRLPKFRGFLGQCEDWRGDAVGGGLNQITGEEVKSGEEEEGTGRSWLILGGWESVEGHKNFQASDGFQERPKVDGKVEACHVVFRSM